MQRMRLFKRKRNTPGLVQEDWPEPDHSGDEIMAGGNRLTDLPDGSTGWSADSPNGRYTIKWSGREGGYSLAGDHKTLVNGRLVRPEEGHVSDTGTFVICDWLDESLTGCFYAFDLRGYTLIKRVFQANLLNGGVSPDGSMAVCQTAHCDTDDGNILTLFSLKEGTERWRIHPPTGWADHYSFAEDGSAIYVEIADRGRFRYDSTTAEFLDQNLWEESILVSGSPFDAFALGEARAAELSSVPSAKEIETVIETFQAVLRLGITKYPNLAASAHRAIGEHQERVGDEKSAIASYERALTFDAKVGVKRRLAILKKDTD
jgi:hypothetical protein